MKIKKAILGVSLCLFIAVSTVLGLPSNQQSSFSGDDCAFDYETCCINGGWVMCGICATCSESDPKQKGVSN